MLGEQNNAGINPDKYISSQSFENKITILVAMLRIDIKENNTSQI